MALRAAVLEAQQRAAQQGLVGDKALSAITDQIGAAPREVKLDNDHECAVTEGVPVIGRQIIFDGSVEPQAKRRTSMPERMMRPAYVRKIRQPEFRVLTTPQFGELVYLIDCSVYPHAAGFLSQYIASPRMRARANEALLPALPGHVHMIWGEDADVETGLDDIDLWYTTCAYAAYLDEIGAFHALLRALRLIGKPNEVVVDVFRTLGAAEVTGMKNELWDMNMMTPAAAMMTYETANLGGGYFCVDKLIDMYVPKVQSFFGAQNIYVESKFFEYLPGVESAFGVDVHSIRMTAYVHWSEREEKNVKTIVREIYERCVANGVKPICARDWAREIAHALRSDLVLVITDIDADVPTFKLCRPPKK